jgi:CPA2 family monovalent cation:H+ antiporter-2
VIFGNAASEDVLKLANLPQARNLLVAISNGFEAGSVCESGRKLNPGISIIARAYSEEEEAFLRGLGATAVIRGEREIGKGILTFLRGDSSAVAAPAVPVPEEPKLPVVENLLEKAAAITPVAAVVAVDAVQPTEPVIDAEASPAEPADAAPVDTAPAVTAETVIELPGPVAEAEPAAVVEATPEPAEAAEPSAADPVATQPEAPVTPSDPVVIDAVETAATADSIIELPGPASEGEPSAATLETVATTPAVGEAPAAIDEIVVTQPADAEPTSAPVSETEAEIAAETETEAEAETNEGGIAPPEDEPEAAERPTVPPVVPEPKG